ncbi:helix-turn-helix domain-containing protein [Streptomyces platensis]|uniref:helix-turn-helix domain-containing protein n=1 Tax=Streptomyces platensis TaxID=58346 RepID=UPI002ED425F7|nr:helix-turn-helix domain-containing protein [Streptomyces platensis]
MAEQNPSAAVRPHSRVRRSATRSGVTHIRQYQPDRYTIIGNHLAQHRDLSLTAIGVGTHILSLPEGASVDIRTLAARFPEGRDRIAFALRELEAHGYVERVRERTAEGRVITRTYAHSAPGVTGPSQGDEEREDGPSPVAAEPPRPQTPTTPAVEEPSDSGEHHTAARALLVALRRTDDRLTLPERDVRRLAPAVAAWFENGASTAAVHRTLTADLPPDLKNPAGLLAHRLRELLPPPLPAGPETPPGPDRAEGRPPRPDPFQTCDGCERAFRGREAGLCRDCRGEPESRDPAIAA